MLILITPFHHHVLNHLHALDLNKLRNNIPEHNTL